MRGSPAKLVALGALALVLVAGCGGSTPAGSASSSATSTSTTSSSTTSAGSTTTASTTTSQTSSAAAGACTGSDVAAALRAGAAAQDAASSYRVTGTVDAGGTKTPYTLEIQKPDRVHAVFGPMEVIGVGATAWRNVGGSWVEQPGMDVLSLVAGKGQLDKEIADKGTFTNVTVDPAANVEGKPATLYAYHESIPSELEADVQLWLDPGTCRPIKNVASSTASSTQSAIDVTYSGWDAVTVEQPA